MFEQKVFVNRILNLKKIKMIGLDMDHTLIRYNSEAFESLVFDLVIDALIQNKHYPADIRTFKFNFKDAIRGLVIDSKNGNILKLSLYGAIRLSYHGTRKMEYAEQTKFYRSTYVDLNDQNYMVIDTSFSIAFCVLYAQLIDYKDEHPEVLPDYQTIALDVQQTVDLIHSNNSLKTKIAQNLDQFVIKEEAVVRGLQHFMEHDKKIFILTNSDYSYTKMLLDYAINPFLTGGQTWEDFFTLVITLADKPRFFYDNLKFLEIDRATGLMRNHKGPISAGLYQGGNAKKLAHDFALQGDEILYIGDHIYGDIVRLKKDCNWRTALVVDELGEEIACQKRAKPVEVKISAAMQLKREKEMHYSALSDAREPGADKQRQAMQDEIMKIDQEIAHLLEEQQSYYNPKWDRVFRAGAEESYFAYQAERFACIYMEKIADLLALSPQTYFRPNRRILPHDLVSS